MKISMATIALAVLVGVVILGLGGARPAYAQVKCGDTLGPGGSYKLTEDLTCPDLGDEWALTVKDGAILDLNGHQVTCQEHLCIRLDGGNSQLINGIVVGSLGANVSVLGDGHIVRNIISLSSDSGIGVSGDNNTLKDNIVIASAFWGILVRGNKNLIDGNNVSKTGIGDGFDIFGDYNTVTDNRCLHNPWGFVVGGIKNRISQNIALGNSVDLLGSEETCKLNIWHNNQFTTSDPECIK